MPTKKKTPSKRELIEPHKGDKRFVRRKGAQRLDLYLPPPSGCRSSSRRRRPIPCSSASIEQNPISPAPTKDTNLEIEDFEPPEPAPELHATDRPLVEEHDLTEGGKLHFPKYWHRWMSRYGSY